MRITEAEALARLTAADHGVLCTVHARRGVDAVPVVFTVDDAGVVGVPIDRVKPKATDRLQRERNLEADPRATLLIEQWDREDWSRLWWVRAELRAEPGTDARAVTLRAQLAGRYSRYRDDAAIARMLQLRIVGVTGWTASSA